MATITNAKSINATLSTTTVDIARLLQAWDAVEVVNHDASTTLYVTQDGSTPTAGAEGTTAVLPGERITLEPAVLSYDPADGTEYFHEVRVLGNGGAYSVNGLSVRLAG